MLLIVIMKLSLVITQHKLIDKLKHLWKILYWHIYKERLCDKKIHLQQFKEYYQN